MKMIAKAFSIAIAFIMTNHLYQFAGNVYQQAKGAPIGLEISGVLATLTMLHFDKMFKRKMNQLGLKLHLYKRYVDDCNLAVTPAPRGAKIEEGKLVVPEDEDDGRPPDQRTAELVKQIADSIYPGMITMETDFPSNQSSGRIPILDLEVWIGPNQEILHNFYQKPVSSKRVLSARTAFSSTTKMNMLVAERWRRVFNISPSLPWEEKAKVLTQFNLAMLKAGHSENFRRTVTMRILAKYDSSMDNRLRGKAYYRTKQERQHQWEMEGGKADNTSWVRNLSGNFTTFACFPATIDGELPRTVQELADQAPAPTGTRCKMIQDGGKPVSRDLQNSNPFPNGHCGRNDCYMCNMKPSFGKCYKSNIEYQFECARAPCNRMEGDAPQMVPNPQMDHLDEDEEVQEEMLANTITRARYQGESSRTAYTRAKAHLDLYTSRSANQRAKSFMFRHAVTHHEGLLGPECGKKDFNMTITGSFYKPMDRILDESIRIKHQEDQAELGPELNKTCCKVESLNSKQDYFQSSCVRTTFTRGAVQ